ncbi:hypothetical protein [Kluyvera intermedia]|uniref:hypothetical protein n=1 Tax=Kluyvera intermedia TaxID=61648 RepID=UPI00372D034A
MKKLLIRLIPENIYQALEAAANYAERSLEGHARYIRGARSNDVKNHAKRLIHCLY